MSETIASDPARAAFAQEFSRLLKDLPWSGKPASSRGNPALRTAFGQRLATMAAFYPTDGRELEAPIERTIRNWSTGASPMDGRYLEPACDALFGRSTPENFVQARKKLVALWTAIQPAASGPREWRQVSSMQTPEMVELTLHPPQPQNYGEDHRLLATLYFATLRERYGDATVYLGLAAAHLAVHTKGCQQAHNSGIGQLQPNDHVQRVAHGFGISGPLDGHRNLNGPPLGDRALCVIEPTGGGEEQSIAAQVAADADDISITGADRIAITGNRDKILKALIYKGRDRDDRRRVILARTEYRR